MKTARVKIVIVYADGHVLVTSKLYKCSDQIDCVQRYHNWRDVMLRENSEIYDVGLRSIEMLP